eukprot:TRINITY_DN3238_c0_g1_i1.p1 TRINITY_DN3238_c0_g1~~TRINITY_DN3238_c0_g1_i1.p1  ORF type:complete len:2710 (-),score=994.14 TRINITY_DN3238_c0_g1_i1:183-8312(-)
MSGKTLKFVLSSFINSRVEKKEENESEEFHLGHNGEPTLSLQMLEFGEACLEKVESQSIESSKKKVIFKTSRRPCGELILASNSNYVAFSISNSKSFKLKLRCDEKKPNISISADASILATVFNRHRIAFVDSDGVIIINDLKRTEHDIEVSLVARIDNYNAVAVTSLNEGFAFVDDQGEVYFISGEEDVPIPLLDIKYKCKSVMAGYKDYLAMISLKRNGDDGSILVHSSDPDDDCDTEITNLQNPIENLLFFPPLLSENEVAAETETETAVDPKRLSLCVFSKNDIKVFVGKSLIQTVTMPEEFDPINPTVVDEKYLVFIDAKKQVLHLFDLEKTMRGTYLKSHMCFSDTELDKFKHDCSWAPFMIPTDTEEHGLFIHTGGVAFLPLDFKSVVESAYSEYELLTKKEEKDNEESKTQDKNKDEQEEETISVVQEPIIGVTNVLEKLEEAQDIMFVPENVDAETSEDEEIVICSPQKEFSDDRVMSGTILFPENESDEKIEAILPLNEIPNEVPIQIPSPPEIFELPEEVQNAYPLKKEEYPTGILQGMLLPPPPPAMVTIPPPSPIKAPLIIEGSLVDINQYSDDDETSSEWDFNMNDAAEQQDLKNALENFNLQNGEDDISVIEDEPKQTIESENGNIQSSIDIEEPKEVEEKTNEPTSISEVNNNNNVSVENEYAAVEIDQEVDIPTLPATLGDMDDVPIENKNERQDDGINEENDENDKIILSNLRSPRIIANKPISKTKPSLQPRLKVSESSAVKECVLKFLNTLTEEEKNQIEIPKEINWCFGQQLVNTFGDDKCDVLISGIHEATKLKLTDIHKVSDQEPSIEVLEEEPQLSEETNAIDEKIIPKEDEIVDKDTPNPGADFLSQVFQTAENNKENRISNVGQGVGGSLISTGIWSDTIPECKPSTSEAGQSTATTPIKELPKSGSILDVFKLIDDLDKKDKTENDDMVSNLVAENDVKLPSLEEVENEISRVAIVDGKFDVNAFQPLPYNYSDSKVTRDMYLTVGLRMLWKDYLTPETEKDVIDMVIRDTNMSKVMQLFAEENIEACAKSYIAMWEEHKTCKNAPSHDELKELRELMEADDVAWNKHKTHVDEYNSCVGLEKELLAESTSEPVTTTVDPQLNAFIEKVQAIETTSEVVEGEKNEDQSVFNIDTLLETLEKDTNVEAETLLGKIMMIGEEKHVDEEDESEFETETSETSDSESESDVESVVEEENEEYEKTIEKEQEHQEQQEEKSTQQQPAEDIEIKAEKLITEEHETKSYIPNEQQHNDAEPTEETIGEIKDIQIEPVEEIKNIPVEPIEEIKEPKPIEIIEEVVNNQEKNEGTEDIEEPSARQAHIAKIMEIPANKKTPKYFHVAAAFKQMMKQIEVVIGKEEFQKLISPKKSIRSYWKGVTDLAHNVEALLIKHSSIIGVVEEFLIDCLEVPDSNDTHTLKSHFGTTPKAIRIALNKLNLIKSSILGNHSRLTDKHRQSFNGDEISSSDEDTDEENENENNNKTWTCPTCTLINKDENDQCDICSTPRSNTWTCDFCTLINKSTFDVCGICNGPRVKKDNNANDDDDENKNKTECESCHVKLSNEEQLVAHLVSDNHLHVVVPEWVDKINTNSNDTEKQKEIIGDALLKVIGPFLQPSQTAVIGDLVKRCSTEKLTELLKSDLKTEVPKLVNDYEKRMVERKQKIGTQVPNMVVTETPREEIIQAASTERTPAHLDAFALFQKAIKYIKAHISSKHLARVQTLVSPIRPSTSDWSPFIRHLLADKHISKVSVRPIYQFLCACLDRNIVTETPHVRKLRVAFGATSMRVTNIISALLPKKFDNYEETMRAGDVLGIERLLEFTTKSDKNEDVSTVTTKPADDGKNRGNGNNATQNAVQKLMDSFNEEINPSNGPVTVISTQNDMKPLKQNKEVSPKIKGILSAPPTSTLPVVLEHTPVSKKKIPVIKPLEKTHLLEPSQVKHKTPKKNTEPTVSETIIMTRQGSDNNKNSIELTTKAQLVKELGVVSEKNDHVVDDDINDDDKSDLSSRFSVQSVLKNWKKNRQLTAEDLLRKDIQDCLGRYAFTLTMGQILEKEQREAEEYARIIEEERTCKHLISVQFQRQQSMVVQHKLKRRREAMERKKLVEEEKFDALRMEKENIHNEWKANLPQNATRNRISTLYLTEFYSRMDIYDKQINTILSSYEGNEEVLVEKILKIYGVQEALLLRDFLEYIYHDRENEMEKEKMLDFHKSLGKDSIEQIKATMEETTKQQQVIFDKKLDEMKSFIEEAFNKRQTATERCLTFKIEEGIATIESNMPSLDERVLAKRMDTHVSHLTADIKKAIDVSENTSIKVDRHLEESARNIAAINSVNKKQTSSSSSLFDARPPMAPPSAFLSQVGNNLNLNKPPPSIASSIKMKKDKFGLFEHHAERKQLNPVVEVHLEHSIMKSCKKHCFESAFSEVLESGSFKKVAFLCDRCDASVLKSLSSNTKLCLIQQLTSALKKRYDVLPFIETCLKSRLSKKCENMRLLLDVLTRLNTILGKTLSSLQLNHSQIKSLRKMIKRTNSIISEIDIVSSDESDTLSSESESESDYEMMMKLLKKRHELKRKSKKKKRNDNEKELLKHLTNRNKSSTCEDTYCSHHVPQYHHHRGYEAPPHSYQSYPSFPQHVQSPHQQVVHPNGPIAFQPPQYYHHHNPVFQNQEQENQSIEEEATHEQLMSAILNMYTE